MSMNDFELRNREAKKLIASVLEQYQAQACPCAFPRFRQIVSIDCASTGNSYTCYDTEIFIDLARPLFDVSRTESEDENYSEKWLCKTCGSEFEYGWSDFSIYVDRQKLIPVQITTSDIGPPAQKPVPLYVGILGHSNPPDGEMKVATYEEFKQYIQYRDSS